jgi:Putative restriction endonuclease
MRKMYKFIWHRGILAMWVVHPVYRGLLIAHENPREGDVSLKLWRIPVISVHVAAADGRREISLNPPGWIEYPLRVILRKPGILSVPLSAIWLVASRQPDRRERTTRWQRVKVYMVLDALLVYVVTLVFTSNLIINLVLAMARTTATTVKAVASSVPALLAVLFVGFATGDSWRIFGEESSWRFSALVTVLIGAGLAAMAVNLHTPDGWRSIFLKCQLPNGNVLEGVAALEEWGKRTPARKLPEQPQPVPPLGSPPAEMALVLARARTMLAGNVCVLFWLTMVFSVIWTAICVSVLFVVIGLLAISLSTTNDLLSSQPGHPLAVIVYHFGLLGQQVVITRQLLLLSVVLGSVAALTFATSILQDPDSRPIFEDHALKSLRRAFAALGYYLAEVAALLRQIDKEQSLATIDGIDAKVVRKFLQTPAALGQDRRPDVIVYRAETIDIMPARPEHVLLIVEVVSPGSETTDRVVKMDQYGKAGIPFYWRAEFAATGVPVVYTYVLDAASKRYRETEVFTGTVKAAAPFPVEIDLMA